MMWIYVVLSVVILIAIVYLFRKDKDILSGTDPTVSLQRVEITIERQDDDDNIENYTLNKDVDVLINLSWTNGVGWDDRFIRLHMKLYFGDVEVAERIMVKNTDPEYFRKFAKLSMSFGNVSENGEVTPFKDSIKLDDNIIGKLLYFKMTVTDGASEEIEVFRQDDDTNGKRELIDQTKPPKPIKITEEQIKRVVELTGLEKIVFPLNISELTSTVSFGEVDYLQIYLNIVDNISFSIKPTGTPGEFIYYKDNSGKMYYVPGKIKFYAPVIALVQNYAAISYTSPGTGREYLLRGGKFIPEDEFKSIPHTSMSPDKAPDYLVEIVKSNKMSEILTEANFNYVNNLLQNIEALWEPTYKFDDDEYLKIQVTDTKHFFVKPTSKPGEFIYYKNESGIFYYLPGILKFYRPTSTTHPNHAVVSFTRLYPAEELVMFDDGELGNWMYLDVFKSGDFDPDRKTEYLFDIVKSDNVSEMLTKANFEYIKSVFGVGGDPATTQNTLASMDKKDCNIWWDQLQCIHDGCIWDQNREPLERCMKPK